jgi:hypothetical protein
MGNQENSKKSKAGKDASKKSGKEKPISKGSTSGIVIKPSQK